LEVEMSESKKGQWVKNLTALLAIAIGGSVVAASMYSTTRIMEKLWPQDPIRVDKTVRYIVCQGDKCEVLNVTEDIDGGE
jgi:hypothetical protein